MARASAHRPEGTTGGLDRDAAALQDAVADLVRVYQFRDRDRMGYHGLTITQSYVMEAVIRRGPLEESQSFYILHNGAEVSVLDQKNEWLQVIDQAKRIGWVRRDQIMLVNTSLDGPIPRQAHS